MMVGEHEILKKPTVHGKKKKKKRGGAKRKMTHEQTLAYKAVSEWVFSESISFMDLDGFGVQQQWIHQPKEKLLFEFHCHSTCSDGFLSPSKLVERAHQKGVKVLALTDHDTMRGVPEAVEAGCRYGIKVIPGVEISSIFKSRNDSGFEEPVHLLAYYSECGPKNAPTLEKFLENIREGRILRAKNILSKLKKLECPLKWETVLRIAGKGVAPGRLHIARAMLEAGYVENLKQAFSRYLYDGGPAYSTGSEANAEETIRMITKTGGVAVLAHPWGLKNAPLVIRRLKEVGLHGVEVYRSDGKLSVYSDLADAHGLLKMGGSDYHGKGGQHESELGSTSFPLHVVHEFLKTARPVWFDAVLSVLRSYVRDPEGAECRGMMEFARIVKRSRKNLPGWGETMNYCLSSWLCREEREDSEFEEVKRELNM
ncbi:hypothetical protein M569_16504, partial [Genlisea aurea]